MLTVFWVLAAYLLQTNPPDFLLPINPPYLIIYTQIQKCINDNSTTTGIALYDISDHLPIFANCNFHPKCAKKYRPKTRCLKNFDFPSFLEDLNTALFILTFTTKTIVISTSLVTILFLCLATLLTNMLPLGLRPEKKLVPSTNLGWPKVC